MGTYSGIIEYQKDSPGAKDKKHNRYEQITKIEILTKPINIIY